MRNWNKKSIQQLDKAVFSFQRTYEELKLSRRTGKDAERQVFSVPMRNWNPSSRKCSRARPAGFQRTYEELKQVIGNIFENPELCFQRTYEELKHVYALEKVANIIVFSVPMRNWNEAGGRRRRQGDGGFQRTYEELKPASANLFSGR